MGLDLDFVDPPLLPSMALWEPTIPPADLRRVAASLRENPPFDQEYTEQLASGIEQPAVEEAYDQGRPFIARFITVELHPEKKEVAKGIGRIVPADPPPRFGDKYRKRLKSADVRWDAGAIIERLIFTGFALGAATNAVDLDPASIVDVETPDWWRGFSGGIAPLYGELVQAGAMEMDPKRSTLSAITVILIWPAYKDYTAFAGDHNLAKGLNPTGGARVLSYPFYFLAAGWSLFVAHTDRGR